LANDSNIDNPIVTEFPFVNEYAKLRYVYKAFDGKMQVDLENSNLTDEDTLAIGKLLQTNNTLQ
jgi:hypothetical protein